MGKNNLNSFSKYCTVRPNYRHGTCKLFGSLRHYSVTYTTILFTFIGRDSFIS